MNESLIVIWSEDVKRWFIDPIDSNICRLVKLENLSHVAEFSWHTNHRFWDVITSCAIDIRSNVKHILTALLFRTFEFLFKTVMVHNIFAIFNMFGAERALLLHGHWRAVGVRCCKGRYWSLPPQALLTEYCETDSVSAKHEIVANLANFAYNSINHEHLQKLNVVDLFLDLTDDEDLVLRR